MEKNSTHYMLAEIFEQPGIIREIVKKYIRGDRVEFGEFENQAGRFQRIKRAIFLGCGTSFHAAILGNYFFEELAKINAEAEFADEFNIRQAVVEENTAVIAISQSGETGDMIRAAIKAKEKKAFVIAITNNNKSKLSRIADVGLDCSAGEEKAVAATKTFTSQVLLLLFLALYQSGWRKRPLSGRKKIFKEISALPEKIEEILRQDKEIRKIAKKRKGLKSVSIMGEKFNYPIALEGALKLKETAYVRAEGYTTREFEHGPLALAGKGFVGLVLAPADRYYSESSKMMQKVRKAKGETILITTQGKENKIARETIHIPPAIELLSPILTVIPIQLLAYYLAMAKNLNVDKPRNIGKYVK